MKYNSWCSRVIYNLYLKQISCLLNVLLIIFIHCLLTTCANLHSSHFSIKLLKLRCSVIAFVSVTSTRWNTKYEDENTKLRRHEILSSFRDHVVATSSSYFHIFVHSCFSRFRLLSFGFSFFVLSWCRLFACWDYWIKTRWPALRFIFYEFTFNNNDA